MEPQDLISIMPKDVITNILNRLPTDEAVRTSILARNWRFKWTMLTQLVLDENFFRSLVRKQVNETYLSRNLRKKSRFKWKNIAGILSDRKSCQHLPIEHRKRDISILPFLIRGSITKFVLYLDHHIERHQILDLEDVNHWVLYLSRKGIRDLTLKNRYFCPSYLLKPPSQIYSCMELKHLTLHGCHLHPPSSFHGLPNLLSLDLFNVTFEGCTCEEFIAWCPLLENLTITGYYTAKLVELVEIAELKNLKILSMGWSEISSEISSSSIFLLSSLPKLQELNLNFRYCELLAAEGVKKEVSAEFLCLKTLNLSEINFYNNILVSSIFEMICGSPNLQTLEIIGQTRHHPPAIHSLELDCKTKGQLQLQSVVFAGFRGLENEVCLIKFILARSPLLKNFVIRAYYTICLMSSYGMSSVDTKQLKINWELAMKLLNFYRASPVAEIDLCGFFKY